MRTNRKKKIIKPTNIETPTQFQVNENNESCNVYPLNQSSRNTEINEKENKNGDVILVTRSSIVQQQLKKHPSETQNSDVCLKENQNSPYTVKRKKGKLEKDSIVNFIDCKMCSKKFRLQESYRAHMRVHAGEKLFTCHICGKQFSQTGSLYYHLKHVHAGVKNHSCDICGRCFAMKTAMEDHRRIHTDERPYVCDSCGKTFRTKASLYIHNRTHTNDYPHKCSYCAKAFRWKQQMIGHLTIHTGEKNHTCDICGKRFGVKNDLTRHRRTHSLEKPYVCGQCGISFGQKRYLKSHERARHK